MGQSSLEIIDSNAFNDDEAIKEIALPSTLKNIRWYAFGGCRKLRKIISLATTPPQSENHCFSELHYSDAVVYVPNESVAKYRQTKEWCNFIDIRPLSEEKPFPETATLSYNGLNYEINLTDNYAKVTGNTSDYYDEYIIPCSVEYDNQIYPVKIIGYSAFCYNKIKRIDAHLSKIGISSFRSCKFNDKFEVPSTLEVIPYRAFAAATIPYLILSENISYIGSETFGYENVYDYIENKYVDVKTIDTIESRSLQPPTISDDTFDQITYDETFLKVPFGFKKLYANAPGWCNFKNISNIGDEQEQIVDNDLTLLASIQNNSVVRNRMPLTVAGTVRNSGVQKISGFNLSWYIDGKYLGEKHFDVELAQNEVFSFEDKITTNVDYAGTHELKLLVSIDGVEDQDNSDNAVALYFESFDKGYYRVSLIEQFASEACSITPISAPKIISGIEKSGYSDFVAHVTHHCGFYDDFLTLNHDYEWFYNDYGTYTPAMMINRSDISNTGYTPVNGVSDDVDRHIINEAGLCNALVSVYCDVTEDKVCVKTLLEKNEDFDLESGYDYLTVFLVEDSILAQAQVDPWSDGYIEGYIHCNTLRKVLSGPWGNKIVWTGDICALKFESEIDASWNKDNLKAVAFIHRYDPTSPVNCQIYTANSSALPQYGIEVDDNLFKIMPTSLVLSATKWSGKIGESVTLTADVLPENATDKTVKWMSDNSDVAIVDADGKVTAVGIGEATITATAVEGSGVSGSCKVTIMPTLGDSNANGTVNIADAVNTANYAVGNEVENFCFEAADVNADGEVTVADASGTVTIILVQPVQESRQRAYFLPATSSDEVDCLRVADYSATIGETATVGISLDNSIDYVALQADIVLPEGLTLLSVAGGIRAAGHALTTRQIDSRRVRVVLFDLGNSAFVDSRESLIELKVRVDSDNAGDIVIENIIVSDAAANEYRLASTGGHNNKITKTEGVASKTIQIEATNGAINVYNATGSTVAVYGVDGRVLTRFVAKNEAEHYQTAPGIYIVSVGSRMVKVVVK